MSSVHSKNVILGPLINSHIEKFKLIKDRIKKFENLHGISELDASFESKTEDLEKDIDPCPCPLERSESQISTVSEVTRSEVTRPISEEEEPISGAPPKSKSLKNVNAVLNLHDDSIIESVEEDINEGNTPEKKSRIYFRTAFGDTILHGNASMFIGDEGTDLIVQSIQEEKEGCVDPVVELYMLMMTERYPNKHVYCYGSLIKGLKEWWKIDVAPDSFKLMDDFMNSIELPFFQKDRIIFIPALLSGHVCLVTMILKKDKVEILLYEVSGTEFEQMLVMDDVWDTIEAVERFGKLVLHRYPEREPEYIKQMKWQKDFYTGIPKLGKGNTDSLCCCRTFRAIELLSTYTDADKLAKQLKNDLVTKEIKKFQKTYYKELSNFAKSLPMSFWSA